MEQQGTTEERTALWLSMADHFLDTETRHRIPETARLCVAAGLTVEDAREAWCHEVSPVVSFNLHLVAGEWAAWDETWLIERIEQLRLRPRGRFRRFLDRSALRSGFWRSIERCMLTLHEVPPEERGRLTADLAALARHFFNFSPAPLDLPDETSFARLSRASSLALQALAPASEPGAYAACCARMMAALSRSPVLEGHAQP